MKDVFGTPQSMLIVGGNSDIAMAILKEILALNRLRQLFLVTRDGTWSHQESFAGTKGFSNAEVQVFKMGDFSVSNCLKDQKIDLCLVTTGFLPMENQLSTQNVSESIEANFALPSRLVTDISLSMQIQGYGLIIGLSSIAAVRIRPDNWIYGIAKLAFDRFLFQLSSAMKGSGVNVLIFRPGMVRTKMSAHLKEAPLTVGADEVAKEVIKNLRSESRIIWIPRQIRWVAFVIRILPSWLLRRMKG
jgi:decaprenylphospho-beta-D-erythro-pentofuranosid-2-ulose 2-reductase